jgi:hypothetical protein
MEKIERRNRTTTPSGRKLRADKERERRIKKGR